MHFQSRILGKSPVILAATVALAAGLASAAPVDFAREIQPLLKQNCLNCHARGKYSGGLSLESRADMLAGGESGPAATPGQADESLLVARLIESDESLVMPQSGKPLAAEQIAIIKQWINEGATWPEEISFGFPRAELPLRRPDLPEPVAGSAGDNPIDRLLQAYLAQHPSADGAPLPDRLFARRVSLDLIGLLPDAEFLDEFERDKDRDKRARLVDRLLGNRRAYAEHWLAFWNDLLRNEYRGTGYSQNGRKAMTTWLYRSLYDNKPYDHFVHQLVRPVAGSEGFVMGVSWWSDAGSPDQLPAMQAAENVSQVFLGTNLKCASCHDSFVNNWKLTDAYALAAVFSDKPLELHRCEKPTGQVAAAAFLYPQLGAIDPSAPRTERMAQLADLLVQPGNGRLARTIVNRLWTALMGRGLVEPIDDMDQPAWHPDLLDWLAWDLVQHDYDLKHTLRLICTSRAYQRPALCGEPVMNPDYVFAGPYQKRMTAEQFLDAVSMVTGAPLVVTDDMLTADAQGQGGQVTAVAAVDGPHDKLRGSLLFDGPLVRALGRPNRDQVITRREALATALQAIELTNGSTLHDLMTRGSAYWLKKCGGDRRVLADEVYRRALGRLPVESERDVCRQIVSQPPSAEEIRDFLWMVAMLPEFQLID